MYYHVSYLSCHCRIVELVRDLIRIRFYASNEEWICLKKDKNDFNAIFTLNNILDNLLLGSVSP